MLATSLLGLCFLDLSVSAATITGTIRDANNNSYLGNVSVTLPDLSRQVTTNRSGDYTINNVPAGEYRLVASYIGYDDVTQTVNVREGSDNRTDLKLGEEVFKLAKFVVAGDREGQAKALQQKRISDSILDIVSADSAGKLPDGNAAEAASRLPGVYARIDQGEGRYIVVRGIDPNLNNVLLNGMSVGSPSGSDRGAALDSVPSDLIGRIEVIKAVTPDMDAQAVGASVNIVTPSAFDRPDPYARGTVAGGYYNGPSSAMPRSGSAMAATQFGGGKWGILVGASYSYRHYISNRRSGGGEWFPSAATGDGANIFFPSSQSLYFYDEQRWRQGINANLEFKPNENNFFYFRAILNRFKDDEGRDLDNFEFYRTTFPASYTATTAHFTGGRSSIEFRHFKQISRINNFSVGGKNKFLDGTLQLDYNFSTGDTGTKVPARVDWQFRSAANMVSDLDTSTELWKVTPQPAYYDLANYPMRALNVRTDDQFEVIDQGAINLKGDHKFFGYDGFWQIGGKGLQHTKGWTRKNLDYIASLFTLAQYPELTLDPHTLMDGYFPMTRRVNFGILDTFMAAHPTLFPLNVPNSVSDSNANYYHIEEDQYAGYAMAKVNINKWSILAGVRVEDTKVHVIGIENPTILGVAQDPRQYTSDGKYSHLLPGLHVKYTANKHLQFHFAYTNTIGRPSYSLIGVRRSFSYTVDPDVPGGTTYIGSVTDGNPDLKAFESRNFDLSAEYYLNSTGIVSVGGFTKYIQNPIYTYAYTARNTTFENLAFSSLSYSKPLNGTKGTVTGIEFNYQQQFTKLPAPFDGLGFSANLTLVDSSESVPTRPGEKLPFAAQASKLYTAQLFYEKYRIQARLAYSYTGAFRFSGVGSTVNADDYQSARRVLDAKVSYRLNKYLTLFADVSNLGQEPLDEYAAYANRQSATERYWYTANFGVNWNL